MKDQLTYDTKTVAILGAPMAYIAYKINGSYLDPVIMIVALLIYIWLNARIIAEGKNV